MRICSVCGCIMHLVSATTGVMKQDGKSVPSPYRTYRCEFNHMIVEPATPPENKYAKLEEVFKNAVEQAQYGKGRARHVDLSSDDNFESQKMCQIGRWVQGSPAAGPLHQAIKKSIESARLEPEAAIAELYGAMNYLAGAIILISEKMRGIGK